MNFKNTQFSIKINDLSAEKSYHEPVCFLVSIVFLKKLNFYFYFFLASNYFFVFLDDFNVLI